MVDSCYMVDSLVVWPSGKMKLFWLVVMLREVFVIGCNVKMGSLNQFGSSLCVMLDVS